MKILRPAESGELGPGLTKEIAGAFLPSGIAT